MVARHHDPRHRSQGHIGRYARLVLEDSQIAVKRARSGDEREVGRFAEAFDYDILPADTRRFLADERHVLVLAYFAGRPAGFVSAVEVLHPDKPAELFLNEIGVMQGLRRLGIARALIEELKQLGREQKCATMWVLTDSSNVAAMALYRSTGGRTSGDPQVMFEYGLAD
jgi:ribosomal protein S18 acetylase RimI-like enzyme